MKSLSCILLAGLLPFFVHAQISKDSIDKIVKSYIQSKKNHGLIIGVINGNTRQVFIYGEADKRSGIRPDTNSIFEIGSITKVFTTSLLADMEIEGLVRIDEPVQKFLPNSVKVPAYQKIICQPVKQPFIYGENKEDRTMIICYPDPKERPKEILFCDLATHTSGLPQVPGNLKRWKYRKNPYARYTKDDLYAYLNHYRIEKRIGFNFKYSHLGIALIGHALTLKTQKSYDELLTERICSKLDMHDTKVSLAPEQEKRFLTGHDRDGKISAHWDFDVMASSAGLHSTVPDMMKFVSANLGIPRTPLTNAFDYAHNGRLEIGNKKNKNCRVGLGWMINTQAIEGRNIVWHSGITGGFSSYIGFVETTKTGVVVLSNSASSVNEIGVEILKMLNNQLTTVQK